jgi:hypothetical protein
MATNPQSWEDAAGVHGTFAAAPVVIGDHLRTRLWLHDRIFRSARRGTRTYRDEAALWADALGSGALYETERLRLEEVDLLEWIPRSPGLYHTDGGSTARGEAERHVLAHEEGGVVLDPIGKAGMVWGGLGCVRLAMKDVGGLPTKFMCATSSGRAHRGFVVAVGGDDYARIAGDIVRRGSVPCSVKGRLRVATPDSGLPIGFGTGVPRFYLAADKLEPLRRSHRQVSLDVTPAVTFKPGTESPDDLWPDRPYYAYAHFDPSRPGALDACVEWLEDTYVGTRFNGRILTDFDEQVGHFGPVACPLSDVMDLTIPIRTFDKPLLDGFGASAMFFVNTLEMSTVSNVTITGDGNVVGNDNRVITTIHKGLDNDELKTVGEAFALLRGEVASLDEVPDKHRNRGLRAIEDAEEEIASGDPDPEAVKSSLERFRDTMVAAGQTYDATIGWAQRLKGVALALVKIIPAAVGWFAL